MFILGLQGGQPLQIDGLVHGLFPQLAGFTVQRFLIGKILAHPLIQVEGAGGKHFQRMEQSGETLAHLRQIMQAGIYCHQYKRKGYKKDQPCGRTWTTDEKAGLLLRGEVDHG